MREEERVLSWAWTPFPEVFLESHSPSRSPGKMRFSSSLGIKSSFPLLMDTEFMQKKKKVEEETEWLQSQSIFFKVFINIGGKIVMLPQKNPANTTLTNGHQ